MVSKKNVAALKIESGIPIPNKRGGNGVTQAMRQMKVGDSILFPANIKSLHLTASNARIKIATRKVDGGIRAWRIE